MIILIEPDKDVRKNIADLMNRERIIGVDSIQESLQMILKFKNDLDLIVANVNLLSEMLSKHIIDRVCQKLSIDIPPIIAVYKESEEEDKDEFMCEHTGYRVLKYADKDLGFPNRYLEVVQKSCPELVIDYESAREAWLKKQQPQDLVDPRQWLEEEGFLAAAPASEPEDTAKGADDIVNSLQTMFEDETEATQEKEQEEEKLEKQEDYKQMYLDLKKKYEELLKNLRSFTESVTKTDS